MGFKRDDVVNNAEVTNDDNAPSFRYKISNIGNTENNGTKNGIKIAVGLKYLSNFWRSLKISLINLKFKLSLKWIENCVPTTFYKVNKGNFKITDGKPYVPVVTLSIEDKAKSTKQLNEGFRVVNITAANQEKYIRELLDSSHQGVKRLLVLAYDNTLGNDQVSVNLFKKYFLPR